MEALHKIRKGIDTVLSSACVLLFAMMVVVGTYQSFLHIHLHGWQCLLPLMYSVRETT